MADRRALQRLHQHDLRGISPFHHHDLPPISPFQIFLLQNHYMFNSGRWSFLHHYMPAYSPGHQRYNWITPEQEVIDGHICLNDQRVSRIPWEDEAEYYQPPLLAGERTWQSVNNVGIFYEEEETTILGLDGDYRPTPTPTRTTTPTPTPTPTLSDGFSAETISDHLETRTHHESENQETEICAVCQSEYEENENLGRLRCGHEYHSDCITRWLMLRKFCPLCKRNA